MDRFPAWYRLPANPPETFSLDGEREGTKVLIRNEGVRLLTATRAREPAPGPAGGGTTVEVARRPPAGAWLWAIDQPPLLS